MTSGTPTNMNKRQLLQSVVIAVFLGGFVLITAVLPAEYGIDPVGTGELLGFSKLHNVTQESPTQAPEKQKVNINYKALTLEKLGSPPSIDKPIEANNPPPAQQFTSRYDTIQVVIPPKRGIEYKFKALKYGAVKYEWATSNKEIVFIDFHGEVKEPNPPREVFYESYTLAYANNMAGTFTAPFEGKHGWYFKNEHPKEVTVTIRLKGQYKLFD